MKVINLLAGPGAGKTGTGQLLSGLLTQVGYRAHYLPEFAKLAHYRKDRAALNDQVFMLGQQGNPLTVLAEADLDYIVMDGPLLLAALYLPTDGYFPSFEPLVVEMFNAYDNINFFLDRNPAYAHQQHGRAEDADQAKVKDKELLDLLIKHNIPFTRHLVNPELPLRLFELVTTRESPYVPK